MRSRTILRFVFGVALHLFAADYARAQSLAWVKQAGGTISTGGQSVDAAEAIAVDSQGNSYLTGTFRIEATFGAGEPNQTVLTSAGPQNIFVAKYDPNGLLVWARGAGGAGPQDWAWGIAVDSAGNSYVTGWFSSALADFGNGVGLNSPGAFVAKYDSTGNAVWATTLHSGGVAYAIDVDADGNSFVAGATPEPLQLLPLVTVWKVGANGTMLWTRSATGTYGGAALGISVDPDGNSSVTGEVQGGTATFGPGEPNATDITCVESGSGVVFVAKYDTSGNLMWARQSADQFGFGGRGNAIATDAAGSSYLVGMGFTIFGLGEPNATEVASAFVAKYDGLGNFVWARTVAPGFGTVSWLFAIASAPAGDTYITGTSLQGNIFIQKYSGNGDLRWSRRLAAASVDALELRGSGIALDGAGDAYVAGAFSGGAIFAPGEPNETPLTTTSGNLDVDVFVAKYLTDVVQPNRPPVANAGADQPVAVGTSVPLDGNGSTDADGDPLTFDWAFTSKPPASGAMLANATTSNPTFVADVAGAYQVRLVVNDGHVSSAPDTIVITTINRAPSANAGADQSAPAGSTIVLDGSGSSDPDADALTFSWSFVSRPPLSAAVLINPTGVMPSFIADAAGTYVVQLIVNDGNLDSAVDTVSVTITPANPGLLTCGSLTSGTISAAGEVDEFSFFGQAGQIISLALASTGGFSATASNSSAALVLLTPSGVPVGAAVRSNGQATFTLPSTGIYTIRVSAANRRTIGSYNLNLECFFPAPSPDAVALPCGALASGTIDAAAEVDLFFFSGEAGQIISLTVASTGGFTPRASNGSVALTLFAPSGGVVGGTLRSNGQGIFTLPAAGAYVVRVNAANLGAVGSYNVNRECLFPIQSPDTMLSCGSLRSGTIDMPGEVDQFSFAGQAGQIVSLALASTGGFTPRLSNASAALRVFAPSGVEVGPGIRSNGQGTFSLPVSGVYFVQVTAYNLATTGSYNVNMECLFPAASPDAVALSCGTTAPGTIVAAAEVDEFTFSGQAGQTTTLALTTTGGFARNQSSTSVSLTLFAPSGSVVRSLRSNSQAAVTLPTSGSYVVGVSATNLLTTGSYTVQRMCP